MKAAEPVAEVLEQKYAFVAAEQERLLEWLDYALVPDPIHPDGIVNSIYFDTPDLELYRQKRNSEFLKSKVRLRWYGAAAPFADAHEISSFLEVKRKIGTARRKQRTALTLTRESADLFLHTGLWAAAERALENGYAEHSMLVPIAHIQYRRRRYIDPESGARIALDSEICCPEVNRAFLAAEPPACLTAGVLEIKGTIRGLPQSLRAMAFLLQRTAFSKYAQCLEKLTYPQGPRL